MSRINVKDSARYKAMFKHLVRCGICNQDYNPHTSTGCPDCDPDAIHPRGKCMSMDKGMRNHQISQGVFGLYHGYGSGPASRV